tara:strand:+ start:1777 stop:2274 length:498 start_codon:yes stop_codon:yes gene_type:complete
MREIEKPEYIETIVDKKKVYLNIRESRLIYMFHRNLISWEEYEAGSRYRLMCELQSGIKDLSIKIRIDGSGSDIMSMQMGAIFAVKEVDDCLTKQNSLVMKLFCVSNYGIIEIAKILRVTERRASQYVHEGLNALAIYYGYKKVRHTIRREGTKVKRQNLSKVGK